MRVRPATEADTDALVELEAVALGDDAWSPGLVAEGVRGALPTVTWLVAEVGQDAVGHAVVSLAGDVAELQRIGVLAEHRRDGVASALLAAVADLAVADGAGRLLLEVREDNTGARSFYGARGFTEIATRRRYYRDGASAVVLERSLPAHDVRRPTAPPGCGGPAA